MATGEAGNKSVEWRVSTTEGSTVKLEPESNVIGRAWQGLKLKVVEFAKKVWKIGVDDPRKAMHGIKVGLALSLVSLFYYTRPLYDGVGGTAMWAIMTVVVIFDYSVGGSLYKGFNRTIATSTGGALALGIHFFADKSGKTFEPLVLGASLFLLASAATFSRFIPIVKARFDYGITIFILTFSLVSMSGYRVEKVVTMAQQRLSTIAIGVTICFLVCIFICPVWAGGDLHLLIIRNMEKLADSLEGCVGNYFDGSEKNSAGYKCVLNSKASEDSLANLATWEPAHGAFNFRHPWKQYLNVGSAMRYCAYCIEALNGCINSDMQTPEHTKKHLSAVCMKVSSEASKVLKEMVNSVMTMTKSPCIDLLVGEMNIAVEELHSAMRTLSDSITRSSAVSVSFVETLPLITIASLVIEVCTRVEAIVDSVEELASLAGFKPVAISNETQEQDAMKAVHVQLV
ncbi:Aluminum-activated malate transporter protein [Dioscorea alata]|uniref:Aluminum-activated malate transporter protein n=1 Tax=Dioscorea alata TaxID=55571 RepID=A0ACB7V4T7_DIOAL|nr:Aluminum-activated malate transporter protein [Dioscorea alata]